MISVLTQRLAKKIYLKIDSIFPEDVTCYYFAYGANIDPDFIRGRIKNFQIIGLGHLKNYELSINVPCEYDLKGFGGIVSSEGESVYGTLYKVSRRSFKILDWLEWVPFKFYERHNVKIICNDLVFEAYTYFPSCPKNGLYCSSGYRDLLIKGLSKIGAPADYIKKVSSFETMNDFKIDHSFNLMNPSKKRLLPGSFYVIHDLIREKVCSLI